MTISLSIAGAAGRMGRALILAARGDGRFDVVGGTERAGSDVIGTDLGLLDGKNATGYKVTEAVEAACATAQVWIDFTSPAATIAALTALEGTDVKAAIIGTTGFDAAQLDAIKSASQNLAIVQSGNFSLGVNLVAGLVRQAAARLGPDWDIEVVESHHRHKVDAPSGTALMLGHAAAAGRGASHDDAASFARHGQTGPRKVGDIGYAVIRAGGIIGDHEVMFASDDEIVTIAHKAGSRTIFAKGALAAAAWASGQKPGLYSMDDVLGL
jgi:4-hydroxy-tetrahydrodipicolinate reductase